MTTAVPKFTVLSTKTESCLVNFWRIELVKLSKLFGVVICSTSVIGFNLPVMANHHYYHPRNNYRYRHPQSMNNYNNYRHPQYQPQRVIRQEYRRQVQIQCSGRLIQISQNHFRCYSH